VTHDDLNAEAERLMRAVKLEFSRSHFIQSATTLKEVESILEVRWRKSLMGKQNRSKEKHRQLIEKHIGPIHEHNLRMARHVA
jgi:hypothetical protein